MELCLSMGLGFCSPFYSGYFSLHPRIDSLSSSPSLWLGRCILGWPVWPMIGFPLLGVHPSISTVKLIVTGYHCNCLDGQLNCWSSAHWLISVTIMYWLCDQWLGHSRQENLKTSSCVSAVLIHIACDKHLSPGQLTHKYSLHYMTIPNYTWPRFDQ